MSQMSQFSVGPKKPQTAEIGGGVAASGSFGQWGAGAPELALTPVQGLKPQMLCFVHIPKTAGASLYGHLHRHYGEGNILFVPGISPSQISYQIAEAVAGTKPGTYGAVAGHAPYGLHQIYDALDYVTVLRDPIDRIVSHYEYSKTVNADGLGAVGKLAIKRENLTLTRFAEHPVMSNVQTRYLMTRPFTDKTWHYSLPEDGLTEAHLEDAINNLCTFRVVGLYERLPETIELLSKTCGVTPNPLRRSNVTKERPKVADLPANVLEELRWSQRFDCALYEAARILFDEALREHGLEAASVA